MRFAAELRRRPVALGLGLLVSISVGLMIGYHVTLSPLRLESREPSIGLASARVVVYKPQSLISETGPESAGNVGTRALMLANRLSMDSVRAELAADAGVPAELLSVVGPTTGAPTLPTPLAESATEVATTPDALPYALVVGADGSRSVITLRASGPDTAGAARLATAAATSLGEELRSTPNPDAYAVETLGAPHVSVKAAAFGPRRLIPIVVAFLVMSVWCCVIVLSASGPAGRRRVFGRMRPAA